MKKWRLGWRILYGDPVGAGWSGDRIPMGAQYSVHIHTGGDEHSATLTRYLFFLLIIPCYDNANYS